MNILIAGASGLIGQELIQGMAQEHQFTVLGRDKEVLKSTFPEQVTCHTWDELTQLDAHQFDALINLSGFNIAASRWSAKIKNEIITSRVESTKKLVHWVIAQNAKPHIYCANAIGIYGLQDNGCEDPLSEDAVIDFDHPKDFLSEICIKWQVALQEAEQAGLAVTTTRFGVVIKKKKGFLAKMYPSFICGLGSIIGDGRQYLSWVESSDLVNAYRFLLNHPNITGAVNITSPNPVMQKDFANALAQSLHRPLFMRVPTGLIRILLGEMGESLINKGQKVIPKRLIEEGFEFKKSTIAEALN